MHPQQAAGFLRNSDALLSADRYREALRCVLQVFESVDRHPELLIPLCQRLRRFNESGRALALIASADPERFPSAAERTELASLASRCGDQALAETWIDHAVRADPMHAPAQYLRGVVAMFRGDMPQARFALSACLAIAPDFAQAHWVLSTLPDDSGAVDADAVARIHASLAGTQAGGAGEAYLQFALHNTLHALGRHDEAWGALERGCALRREQAPFDPLETGALFAALESRYTPGFLTPADASTNGYTPIFIVGMHRSGTTLLERILGGHPLVADGGESYAFTAQLDLAADHKTAGALDATALQRVADADFAAIGSGFLDASRWRARGRPFLTEKLPPNLLNAGLIAKALPHAKLVRVVRDPMDTCFSNLRTFFAGAAAYSHDQAQLAEHYLRCDRLARHLHKAMPGRILDVAYADLVGDTEATARRVFGFCGLPFAPEALDVGRASGDVSTASTASVRAGILRDRGGAWKPYARQLRPMREALEARRTDD
ncbi:MAG TPA: sulfotransferase [Lysobacter sp.]|nr:sulfotransferase [Lysobacter sp.]